MQEPLLLDPATVGVLVSSVLAVVTTILTVLSYRTARRVVSFESHIKETKFSWRSRKQVKRELVAKLRVVHVLETWTNPLVRIGEIPWHNTITSLIQRLKPLADGYGDLVPEVVILHNELDLGMVMGECTESKDMSDLGDRVAQLIPQLREDIESLGKELGLQNTVLGVTE